MIRLSVLDASAVITVNSDEPGRGLAYIEVMQFQLQFEREIDGRWIAEIPSLPGVMAYGTTRAEAESRVQALALRVTADQIEQQHTTAQSIEFTAS